MKHRIALFKNDRKQTEAQPDYKGYDKETGNSIAGWIKEANGKKYISIVFETPDESKPAAQQSPGIDGGDDDIPF